MNQEEIKMSGDNPDFIGMLEIASSKLLDSFSEGDVCVHYFLSRSQRKTEIERGLDDSRTSGYELRGCYTCEGLNFRCNLYAPKSNFERMAESRGKVDALDILAGMVVDRESKEL